MKEKVNKTLKQFLDGGSEIWIKFNSWIDTGYFDNYGEGIVHSITRGSVRLKKCTPRFSNLQLVDSTQECMEKCISKSKRITRIRRWIFLDSQLFVKTQSGNILKLSKDTGLIHLEVSDTEFKALKKQLKY